MTRETIPLRPPQAVTAVSGQWWEPSSGRGDAVVVLAHGAGSRLDHPLHQRMGAAVSAAGFTAFGFNFAYSEAGRRSPDPMPRLLSAYTDVVAHVRAARPGRPVVIGGRSMGGRAASLLVAGGLRCDGLVLLNYPLLPISRRPDSRPRIDHWPDVTGPVLFVHGTRDRLWDDEVFAAARDRLAGADVTIHVIDDADHSFAVRKSTGRTPSDVDAEIGQAVATWLLAVTEPVRP